jgi:hypothetical protein
VFFIGKKREIIFSLFNRVVGWFGVAKDFAVADLSLEQQFHFHSFATRLALEILNSPSVCRLFVWSDFHNYYHSIRLNNYLFICETHYSFLRVFSRSRLTNCNRTPLRLKLNWFTP